MAQDVQVLVFSVVKHQYPWQPYARQPYPYASHTAQLSVFPSDC